MMESFPKDWELVSFFEVEPEVAYPDLPWAYNQLTFMSQRGDDHVVCEIAPVEDSLTFRWWHRGIEHISLQLNLVKGLSIELAPDQDILTVFFRYGGEADFVHPLRIQLRPFVSLSSH